MEPIFDKHFYTANRKRLVENLPDASIILIAANSLVQKNADESYPFRQDSSFWYFTGLDVADTLLIIDKQNNQEYVVMPYRHSHRDQWETALDLNDIQATSGIPNVMNFKQGMKLLRSRLVEVKTVHTLLPPTRRFRQFYGMHPNPARDVWLKRIKRINPEIKIESISSAITKLRIIKQTQELDAIQKAIAITEESLEEVNQLLPELRYEYEIRAVLHAGFQRRGAGSAFESIVAAGGNAAILHYEKSNKELKSDELLLIDTGAAVSYYAADITRMFMPRNGMNKRQEEVYAAVKRAHEFAAGIMKPGTKHREYEDKVREFIGRELVSLGLLKKPSIKGIQKYFPSLTSHHLGLDVHDVSNYNEVFSPGMVLTIEPGIYIPEEGIGVRIEDDVVVTKTGIRILSKKLYN